MSAPLYVVILIGLACLILGALLGLWIADRERAEEREERMSSRIAGPGLPTEEDEALPLADEDVARMKSLASDVGYLRKRGWL